MKKLKYLLLMLSLAVITSCGNNNVDTCDHSKSDWIIDLDATCTSEGLKHIECTKCKEVIKTETINKTNHDLVHHEAVDTTCTTSGYNAYDTCKNCSYTTYQEIKALGHNYINDECTRCHNKEEQSNLIYELNNSKTGYWVTGVKEETSKVIVPSTYNNIPVIGIEEHTFNNCNIVEEIEIADSVIYILDDFSGCNNLNKLSLPANASLTINNNELKEIIFTSDIGLENIKSLNKKINLDDANFRFLIYINAEKLEKLILLEDLMLCQCVYLNISSNAYNKYDNGYYLGTYNNPYYELVYTSDTNIYSIDINPNTKVIGNAAFKECSNLTSIEIPNSVTSIGNQAFDYCTSLTSLNIPNSVTSIGDYAFRSIKLIKDLILPNSLINIGNNAFD